jgi:hypothetical protein
MDIKRLLWLQTSAHCFIHTNEEWSSSSVTGTIYLRFIRCQDHVQRQKESESTSSLRPKAGKSRSDPLTPRIELERRVEVLSPGWRKDLPTAHP